MIKKLGKSQTGQIILAVSNTNLMAVAIKTFAKKDIKIDHLIDELKIHLYCHHPNILPAYGININSEEAYLAMEVGEGNLYQKIIKQAPFD
jgi:serine/threonine protein kinase